jgi:hypothetical protein
MVLEQKQTSRPLEQNRGTGYESTQLYPPHFLTKVPKIYDDKEKTASSTNVAGKNGYPSARNRN